MANESNKGMTEVGTILRFVLDNGITYDQVSDGMFRLRSTRASSIPSIDFSRTYPTWDHIVEAITNAAPKSARAA